LFNLGFQLEIFDPPVSKIRCAEINQEWIARRNNRDLTARIDMDLRKRIRPEIFQDLFIREDLPLVVFITVHPEAIKNRKTQVPYRIRLKNFPIGVELINLAVNA